MFFVKKMYNEAIQCVYYLRIREKNFQVKFPTRSRSRPRI